MTLHDIHPAKLCLCCLFALLCVPCPGWAGDPVPMLFIRDALSREDMEQRAASPLPHVNPHAPRGGVLRLTALGTFDNFNPFSPRGLAAAQLSLTYETLGEDDATGEHGIRGLLAEKFEPAPDQSSLTVWLRPQARFSDGRPVTARDVKFSFEALMRDGSPTYRNYYAQVSSVEELSDHVVRFHFSDRNNRELPLIVTQLPILPAHWWQGRNVGEPQREPMPGSGPYRVEAFEMGSSVSLACRTDWWGKDLPASQGRYNFDGIRVEYFRSQDVAREAFLAGQADAYVERTIRNWAASYDTPAVHEGRLLKKEIPLRRPQGMTGFFFNTRRPVFADARVRRAIGLCFDFEWTNKSLFHGAYARCDSFFTNSPFAAPPLPSADEARLLARWRDSLPEAVFGPLPVWPKSDGSGFPRERMREVVTLLGTAGWKLQSGQMVNARGEPLHFTLTLSSPSMQRAVMPLRANLERIGITMDIELPDQTQYVTRVRNFDYDMILATVRQSSSPGNEQRYFWGSGAAQTQGSRNYAGIADAVVDALIEHLITAPDKASLITATRALDRVLQHGFYVLPGWYGPNLFLAYWKDRVALPEGSPPSGVDMKSWYAPQQQKREDTR